MAQEHLNSSGISHFRLFQRVIGITTLLSTIWTFNDFENVYLITGGGPLYASSTIATYTYDMAFIQN